MNRSPGQGASALVAAGTSGELDRLCAAHGVRLLGIFGSAARPDTVDRAVDLDIAVELLPHSTSTMLDVGEALVAIAGREIDLMDLSRAKPVAAERGLVGGIPLFEAQRGDFARRAMAATMNRMDTAWLRRLDLEVMSA